MGGKNRSMVMSTELSVNKRWVMSLLSVRNMMGNLLCNFNSDLGIQTYIYIQYIGQKKKNRNKYILGQSFCLATWLKTSNKVNVNQFVHALKKLNS